MKTSRTTQTSLPISIFTVKDHLRVTHDSEDLVIWEMVIAASREIEASADLAIGAQTITATTDDEVTGDVDLPIGPVAEGAALTVQTIGADGTLTTLASGYWLEVGRYPVLHFTEAPNARLRITYAAGFTLLPADLALAIKEQVAQAYDMRGDGDMPQRLANATARAVARHKRVRL